jgi:ABC-type nitrate/sulfonate/bicarbonate transport system substrate-binding protein
LSGGLIPLTVVGLAPTAVVELAQRRGAFEGLGLKARTVSARSADEQMLGLVGGQWDLAVATVDDVLGWNVERDADVSILAQLECAPMQDLYGPGMGFPGVVLVATQNWLQSHRGQAIRYLRALVNAASWGTDPKNHEEAIELLKQASLPGHAAEHALKILSPDLQPSLEAIQAVVQLHTEIGLLQPPLPDAAALVDSTYLTSAHQGG